MSVVDVIDALERLPRHPAAEGTRYVVISETAVNQIIRELRLESTERPDAEYFQSDHFTTRKDRSK